MHVLISDLPAPNRKIAGKAANHKEVASDRRLACEDKLPFSHRLKLEIVDIIRTSYDLSIVT